MLKQIFLHTPALCRGISLAAMLCAPLFASESDILETLPLTSFSADKNEFGWYVQNDNVMGGRSEGGFNISSGQLIFAGNTNTNGGGFSSIRTQPLKFDLSGYTGVQTIWNNSPFAKPALENDFVNFVEEVLKKPQNNS